jgi:molybdate transport system substrate-binding protein
MSVSRTALAACLVLALSACGGGAAQPRLTVFAAASLTEAFPAIDPGARYDFAASDTLATQIEQGAAADVYASASPRYPQELFRRGLVFRPVTFASNRLVLIVPKANTARIQRVADVARPGIKLVLAARGVPAGDYARDALGRLSLEKQALRNVVSQEADVKGVVGKVALGEADAGFVYRSDAAAARDKLTVIPLPAGAQPPVSYQVAVVKASPNRKAARAFVRAVLAPGGQRVLKTAGFLPAGS